MFKEIDKDKLAQKKKLQMEAIMKESDLKALERKRVAMESEIADFKRKKSQIEFDILQKEKELKKNFGDKVFLLAEIRKIRLKINNL